MTKEQQARFAGRVTLGRIVDVVFRPSLTHSLEVANE
jgi:hypothetical protein